MISQWGWRLAQLTRKLWLRATLISMLAVAAAVASLLISPLLPFGLSAQIGADAVDRILNVIASSMLAVTTFSLSTTVAAYSAATSNVTPRATKLLIEDKTTQNVLATFVGSFLYSMVAIILLAMGAYGERGRVVLFAVTILVIILIVGTLLRWIDYLLKLGRVGETTEAVEDAAVKAMRARKRLPNLGGMPLDGSITIPPNALAVLPPRVGYVQHVDVGAISGMADEVGARIYVTAIPGTFVDPHKAMAWVAGAKGELDPERVAGCFTIGESRSFDQDPRFGLCVMAEIASRALSPGINDPGTAIDVIGRAVRILSIWAMAETVEEPRFPQVYIPSIELADLFDDLLTPIARDGAGVAEVHIRLQKGLTALARTGDPRYREVAARHSEIALEYALAAMASEHDVARVKAAAALVRAEVKGATPGRARKPASRRRKQAGNKSRARG